jgi:hypothetical protein
VKGLLAEKEKVPPTGPGKAGVVRVARGMTAGVAE